MTRIAFLGTPEAAVPSLRILADREEVSVVLTRPDRPAGRKRRLQAPPVKIAATELGLPVVQPESRAELLSFVESTPAPDLGVVVAFGMILPSPVLNWPRHRFLNLHFSLLPRWRGAAPVERALMAGDQRTGVSVMVMEEGLDTGPVIAHESVEIGRDDTGGSLTNRLAGLGASLLAATVPAWTTGDCRAIPQQRDGATYADRILSADRHLNTNMDSEEAINVVRALAPAPGAQLIIGPQPHKILALAPSDLRTAPGTWIDMAGRPVLGFADASLEVVTIQPPGKKPMSGADWLRGRDLPGAVD